MNTLKEWWRRIAVKLGLKKAEPEKMDQDAAAFSYYSDPARREPAPGAPRGKPKP